MVSKACFSELLKAPPVTGKGLQSYDDLDDLLYREDLLYCDDLLYLYGLRRRE